MPAQESLISGTVIDQSTKKTIPFAIVLIKGTKTSVYTNDEGCFKIKSNNQSTSLVIYQFGYFTKEISIRGESNINIELKSKAFELNEVTVLSKKIDTLQRANTSVFLAFEFYDNYIVALVNKGQKYNLVQIVDDQGIIIKEKKAPENVEKMYVDCFGNIQLISKQFSYQFFYDYEKIIYLEKIPIIDFYSKLMPCQCVFGNYAYFKEISMKRLKNRYFYISRNKSADKKILTEISNKPVLDMFNRDFDINYFLAQRRSGGGYSTSVDELTKHLDLLREEVQLSSQYAFKLVPVESEMVKRDSSLLIIDYTNKNLLKYNFLGGLLKKDTLLLSNLVPKSVVDLDRKKIYFVSDIRGSISLYEYARNDNYPKHSIDGFKFIKNLRCRNGILYFLDRDPISENPTMKIFKYQL